MFETVAMIFCGVLLIALVIMGIMLRGALKSEKVDPNFEPRALSGREREEIRRKIVNMGPPAVSSDDVLNLLYTFRQIELGQYTDEDVFVPEDPYEDVS